MARLLILRHGKTEANAASGRDFDRSLTERGRHNSAEAARFIADSDIIPRLVLVSPATRALETWQHVAAAWQEAEITPPEEVLHVIEDARIYGGSVEMLCQVIAAGVREVATKAKAEKTATPVMIVGHNPGLMMLAQRLIDSAGHDTGGHSAARVRGGKTTVLPPPQHIADLPTAGLVDITLPSESLTSLATAKGEGEMLHFWAPKKQR